MITGWVLLRHHQPGTDADRDKTLTEKEEETSDGENKKTPGPVYDV